ncbi:hypothetical protein MB02_12245 [Croceicoccus estronivorus]|uniref:cytochrome P450 n=1 Tax=Croceicoccus estronivorus TaxID=1172626 RepID=UPI0008309F9F|nr:cytochrome P450 [Croceicoccus estronivorus]OCC23482.1 hypothetical protein MB02_12245 [Croceicoccus estronivorus]
MTLATEIYDPFAFAAGDDPFPIYRKLRDDYPLYHNRKWNFFALSRYDDVAVAVRDFRTFSSQFGTSLETLKEQVPVLINCDPPDHTRLRHLIAPLFTPGQVQGLEATVREYAQALLEPVREGAEFDIIADFAAKLPMAIICRLLGFRQEDEDMLREWTDLCVHREEGVFEMPEEGMQATLKLYGYFEKELAARASSPRNDIVQKLADAEKAGSLTREEVLGYLYILSIAGNETTTKLIGNMAWQFDRVPGAYSEARRSGDLWGQAIEEAMRFDGPTHMMARTTTRDVELHGGTIPAGAKVALLYMSGNRDERKYKAPDRFDIARNPRDHLGFGGGLHACLGAALARLEARVAWEELSKMMSEFDIDTSGVKRVQSPQVRGFTSLPLRFAR